MQSGLRFDKKTFMGTIDRNARFYVAGHRGMVGAAFVRTLRNLGFQNILTRTHSELDLTRQAEVEAFFRRERPEYVFVAAAKVGGILANRNQPTEFLYENLMIASNVIRAAAESGVEKLLFLGSSCVFPKLAAQPIREESLLSGGLESTNEAYAIAKIAGLKLTEYYNRQHGKRFISAMPPNLYGFEDNFHLENSHVIPGLMRRLHEAKNANAAEFTAWGTGTPLREFLFVDDLAEACFFLFEKYEEAGFINAGSGEEIAIRDLVPLIADTVGYRGRIVFDPSKPDGTPRKIMDSSRIHALGWKHKTPLQEGLRRTYEWYLGAQSSRN
jgi:GDP-L-fucose synthase